MSDVLPHFSSVDTSMIGFFLFILPMIKTSFETRPRESFEHFRGPKYFKQDEEKFFLFLQILLKPLQIDALDQIPDSIRVRNVANEDPISIIDQNLSEGAANNESHTKIKTHDWGLWEETTWNQVIENVQQ